MQIKYVKALELKLEVCIWVTSWPIDSKLSVLVQRLSDCPNTCGPLWRKCAIFVCANHGGLSWIWTELESLRLFSFFFFYLLHSIFQPFNYCGWHLIHLCSLKDIYWSKGILQNEYEPAFSIFCLHAFCCPLHRFFSLPLPHLHLFYYFFSFCPTLCSVCVGVEPLYRDGVLGRASKAFITAFAVLCYTGKHRATHAWPLTSLWSSAIHEKRGLWPTNLFLI